MKLNIQIACKVALCISVLFLFTRCNDSFLELYPETEITEKAYFKTVKDLEIYTNGLYNLGSSYSDIVSDNIIYNDESSTYSLMRGEMNADKAGNWGWGSLRNINFMLARVGQVSGDEVEVKHYIGLARLFRAVDYYGRVRTYSDVPWYSRDLQTTDTELLYKTQDPRTLIVDSIMKDLEYATTHIKDGLSKTRVFKNTALAVQARIALEEGTFRKYHTELGLNDGDAFLEIAASAAKKVMETKKYSLITEKQGLLEPYTALFSSLDLTNNAEMIMVDEYDEGLGRMHGAGSLFNWTHTISRDLMEDYLVIKNGKAVPFHTIPGYDKMMITEVFADRDPRMELTLMKPGYMRPGSTKPDRLKLNLGGYPQVKFSPTTSDQLEYGKAYTDLPIIRYPEVLLIYAEAKAELGQLKQDDIDNTINLIRRRAKMPEVNLNDWLQNIDPVQEKRYANAKSSQKGAVLEIRRERRVELACEGTRYNDLMRWSCGKLIEKAPEGVYINGSGLHDITGDGIPDIVFGATKAEVDKLLATLTEAEIKEYNLTTYILEGNAIELTEGTKGYIRMKVQVGKWKFEEPKYYYRPISQYDLNVNENLVQNKYWK